jgi:hypothetical protein
MSKERAPQQQIDKCKFRFFTRSKFQPQKELFPSLKENWSQATCFFEVSQEHTAKSLAKDEIELEIAMYTAST